MKYEKADEEKKRGRNGKIENISEKCGCRCRRGGVFGEEEVGEERVTGDSGPPVLNSRYARIRKLLDILLTRPYWAFQSGS